MRNIRGSGGIANGRQCYNFTDDQNTVLDLLSRIPSEFGGAMTFSGAPSWPNPQPGFVAPVLYQAILKFQHGVNVTNLPRTATPRCRSGTIVSAYIIGEVA